MNITKWLSEHNPHFSGEVVTHCGAKFGCGYAISRCIYFGKWRIVRSRYHSFWDNNNPFSKLTLERREAAEKEAREYDDDNVRWEIV